MVGSLIIDIIGFIINDRLLIIHHLSSFFTPGFSQPSIMMMRFLVWQVQVYEFWFWHVRQACQAIFGSVLLRTYWQAVQSVNFGYWSLLNKNISSKFAENKVLWLLFDFHYYKLVRKFSYLLAPLWNLINYVNKKM